MGDMADSVRGYEDEDFVTRFVSGIPTTLRGRPMKREDAVEIMRSLDSEIRNVVKTFGISERFPAQPPSGSVLRWERTFSRQAGADAYTYVALRVNERWYVTGRNSKVVSWEELTTLVGDSPCWLVTAYREIPRPTPDPLESMIDPTLWFETVFGTDTKDQGRAELKTEAKTDE